MAPITIGDLVQLVGTGLLQGITNPLTWIVVLTAAIAVVLTYRGGEGGDGAAAAHRPGGEGSGNIAEAICTKAGDR